MLRKLIGSAAAPALLTALLALPASAQLEAELVVSGLSSPLFVTAPAGEATGRIWVVEKAGRIKVVQGGAVAATFLDIDALINSSGERGLLGLAFHPDYLNNGKFYVSYTDNSGRSMLVQYLVQGDPLTSNTANAGSATTIIGPINQPFSNHNGGCIQFGPDDKLYFGLGDGGSGDDPNELAQNINSLMGKMLRFDVDIAAPYIPNDNPFVGVAGLDEIWLVGLRNPWRFSFDRLTGDLYVGDVGQNAGSGREEIHFLAGGGVGGENFGWDCMYGSVASTAGGDEEGCVPFAPGLINPIHEYVTNSNGGSRSITGGYVYRGSAIPALQGTYFFGDYQSSKIWSFDYTGTVNNFTERTAELEPDGAPTLTLLPSFGEDADGELYMCDMADGEVYKIVEPCPVPFTAACIPVANSSGGGAKMSMTGSTSVTANNLTLVASPVPGGQSGFMITSPAALSPGMPLGNGNLCLDAAPLGFVIRLSPALVTDFLGFANSTLDLSVEIATGVTIDVGETWFFSFWFRDVPAGGAGFNFADALGITFCP